MVIKDIQLIDQTGKTSINTDQICITEMFLWELGKKFYTDDCEAIFFHCGEFEKVRLLREEQDNYDILVPKKSYDVQLPFNKNGYNQLSDLDKKQMLTEALKKGMAYLSELKNWDIEIVNNAVKKMYEKNLNHTFKAWKGKLSPNKKMIAYPLVHLDLNVFKLELVVEDRKKNILAAKLIIKTKPDIDDLAYYMKKLEWFNDNEVRLFTIANKGTYSSINI